MVHQGSKMVDVSIRDIAAEAVRRGHPWVYRDQVEPFSDPIEGGKEVRVKCGKRVVGVGVWSGSSPIAIRVWSTVLEDLDAILPVCLDRALQRRDFSFSDGTTTAFRCLNGEADRAPGFVVDRYANAAVIRVDGDGAEARLAWMVRELWPRLHSRGVRTLAFRTPEKNLEALCGDPPPLTVDVLEHGVPMRVDLHRGQKTGAFLDQRENRRRVRAMAGGRRVLNLFSYAGGFSLHAALGGAVSTTSVDIAARAHKCAQESFELAGVDLERHSFVTADAFEFLEKARSKKETWDLVISDPPSFAPSENAKPRALAAYRKLHRACAAVLAPHGILCAASCSSHVTERDFTGTLDDVTLGRSDLCVRELHGLPEDHPTLAAWPEGRYLKLAVLQ